jgi:hypothetical protein
MIGSFTEQIIHKHVFLVVVPEQFIGVLKSFILEPTDFTMYCFGISVVTDVTS